MNSTRKYYDDLKTNLLTYNNTIKTIMFVGSSLGDGVSTTSIGFSESLAAGSMRGVVLIDANFRAPNLLSRFQIDPKTFGLAEILLDGRQPSPIKIENSNLYVLPCGESRLGPQALFDSSRFSQFLDDMKARFDYVVFDAPPALSATESLSIAAKVDAVILVVRSGVNRREIAKKVKEKIEEVGGNVMGVVLNRRKFYIPDKLYKLFFGN